MQPRNAQQNEEPRVTILTPTWNRAGLLDRLFRSIRSQHVRAISIEWLVVDDGSTDDTASMVAGEPAQGKSAARRVRRGRKTIGGTGPLRSRAPREPEAALEP